MKARLMLTAILAAVSFSGCGPPSPQAPLEQAKKLDESTGGISNACGLSYQVTAFPGNHQPHLAVLEATAASDATKLAAVYAGNPKWIYQGETVHTIVELSLSMLRQCGLTGAAATLAHATGVH